MISFDSILFIHWFHKYLNISCVVEWDTKTLKPDTFFSESPNISLLPLLSLFLLSLHTPDERFDNKSSFFLIVKKNLLNFSISDSVFLARCSVVGWILCFFVLLLSKFFSSLRWCMNKIRKKVSAMLHRRKRTKSTFPFIFHFTVTDITFQFSFSFFPCALLVFRRELLFCCWSRCYCSTRRLCLLSTARAGGEHRRTSDKKKCYEWNCHKQREKKSDEISRPRLPHCIHLQSTSPVFYGRRLLSIKEENKLQRFYHFVLHTHDTLGEYKNPLDRQHQQLQKHTDRVIYVVKNNKFSRQFSTPSNIYYPYFTPLLSLCSSSLPPFMRNVWILSPLHCFSISSLSRL